MAFLARWLGAPITITARSRKGPNATSGPRWRIWRCGWGRRPAQRIGHPRRGRKPEFKEGRYPPLDEPTCSVLAGGVRGHRASSNDATLPKPARPRKRRIRVGPKFIAARSPGGRVLPATSRQRSCPTHRHRPRHCQLADHRPAPTGSNRPLSRLAVTQAPCKSMALGESTAPTRNQSLASQILDKGVGTQE